MFAVGHPIVTNPGQVMPFSLRRQLKKMQIVPMQPVSLVPHSYSRVVLRSIIDVCGDYKRFPRLAVKKNTSGAGRYDHPILSARRPFLDK
jgi:hypothetical protein